MQKAKNNKQPKELSIQIINQNAAGIDVGDRLLSVAVPPGRDEVSVKEFGAFTEDLHALAHWLKKCNIETVAMECTGVYWKNIYTVLIQYGFEVYLVNARHTRNVSGKKPMQKMHSGFNAYILAVCSTVAFYRMIVRKQYAPLFAGAEA